MHFQLAAPDQVDRGTHPTIGMMLPVSCDVDITFLAKVSAP